MTATPLLLTIFPIALIAAAVSDLRRFIIPNWTSLLLIAGFLAASLTAGLIGELSLAAFGLHLAVGAACFLLGFALWACGVWGGGDGKLFAATALWFDPAAAVSLIMYITLIGAGLSVTAVLVYHFRFVLGSVAPVLARMDLEKYAKTAPYGVAIAAGALVAMPKTALFQALMG